MNALASNQFGNQAGLLAAFTVPTNAAPTAPTNPAFVNMISLFLSPSDQALGSAAVLTQSPTGQESTASQSFSDLGYAQPKATPSQIADAMIRSMLGSSRGAQDSLSTTSDDAAANLSSNVASNISTDAGAAYAASTQGSPTPSLAQLSASLAPAAPVPTQPAQATNAASAPAPRKQTRSDNQQAAAAPQTDAVTATMPILSFATVQPPPASTNAAPAPASNSTVVDPQAASLSSRSVLQPKVAPEPAQQQVAFTAVLTPMTQAPAAPTAATIQSVPAPTADASKISKSDSQPQAVQANAAPSTIGASGLQSTSSQQQPSDQHQPSDQQSSNDNAEPKPAVSAVAKSKPVAVKADDNSQATTPDPTTSVRDHAATTSSMLAATPAAATVSTPQAAAPASSAPASAAEALRNSEPDAPAAAPLRTGAAQEITIRIAQPDASPVDLRVMERAGQVHIDVRTADTGMQTSLRQDLGSLTNSLQRAGYHTETFTPSASGARTASSAQTGNQDDHRDSSKNGGGSNEFTDGRRQQQKRSSQWLEELEEQS